VRRLHRDRLHPRLLLPDVHGGTRLVRFRSQLLLPPTSLDLATCVAGDIGNDDGQLTCPTTTGPPSCGLYQPNTLPSGSYEGSCVGCLASGCILECRCPMSSAPADACFSIDPEVFPLCPSSAINLTACGAGDIGNNNGNLSCPAS
jgi:hypothetical protein